MSLAAIHLREEPDALMSARPDLCGGHRATGVPTAINSRLLTLARFDKMAHVRFSATRRMGHHPRRHSVLVVTVHRLVFSCELDIAAETQTKAFRLVDVACR